MKNSSAVMTATLGLFCALPAFATGDFASLITPFDKARLEKYEETRKAALVQSIDGDKNDLAELKTVITRTIVPFTGEGLTGDWQYRTIKVGGDLEKMTGSQRTKGRIYDDGEKRAIYIGTGYVNNENAQDYGNGPQTDQVGYVFRTGFEEWRIEFPAPYYESKLDIIELKR